MPHIELDRRVITERDHLGRPMIGFSTPGRIVLDVRMCRVQARSVLAHELGHHVLGHLESAPTSRYLVTRREVEADQWAASRLVALEALADAMMWCSRGDIGQIAEAMNVDEDVMWLRLQMARRDRTEAAYLEGRLECREAAA